MNKTLLSALVVSFTGAGAASAAVEASFSASQCTVDAFYNGFDSQADLDRWEAEGENGGWRLSSGAYSKDAPAFSAINPDSKSSLMFPRVMAQRDEAVISEEITVQSGDELSFWSVSNPIWLFYARTQLFLIVDGEQQPKALWDNFMHNQNNPTDDTKWENFTFPLSAYAGKKVQLKFLYTGNDGEPVFIDDVRVSRTDSSSDAKVNIRPGDKVDFLNMSQGNPVSYKWSFPGGFPATSSAMEPSVTYSQPGVYDVTLTVTDASGQSSTVTRESFVVVTSKALEAVIGRPAGYLSPEAGLVVPLFHELTFTDLTEGQIDTRTWLMPGTNTPTSSEAAPTVYYVEPGQYDVDLEVANNAGKSSTYVHGVRAGLNSLIWNITTTESQSLATIDLAYFGYYGGSNYLDMPAYAEYFAAPAEPATISEVNVYFGKAVVSAASAKKPITVSVCRSNDGLPGEVLASASLNCEDLIDASQTINDPTTFSFAVPATVDSEFFITIGDFPCESGDEIAIFCSPRREDLTNSTVYHQLIDYDDNYQPLDTRSWVKNADEALSFAIAPNIFFAHGTAEVNSVAADEATPDSNLPIEYYNLNGIRVSADRLLPGLYIKRQGSKATKVIIR